MPQQNPYDQFSTVGAPQAPAPQQPAQPQYPGVIRGAPAAPDPLELENLRLRQEADRRAAEQANRQQQEFEGTGGQGTEAQNKSAVLLGRISGGAADIQDILNSFPEAERPGLAETISYGALGPESVIARQTTDWQRRAINDVQRDIVDALLTMGTGAAYNQEQLEAMRVSYFPQYGDTPEEIAFKRRRLERMIETARLQAGPNAARLDEALAPLLGNISNGQQQDNPTAPPPLVPMTMQDMYPGGAQLAADTWGQDNSFDRERYLQETYGIAPSDERRLVGALNARMRQGNMTADDVRSIYQNLQLPLPDEAGIQQIVDAAANGSSFGGIDASQAERDYQSGLDQVLQQQGDNPEAQGWSGVAGVSQGVTLGLGDELAGVIGGVTAPFRGQNPITAYQAERDLVRRYNERASAENPGTYFTGEIGGALATGGIRVAPASMRAARPVAAAAREGAILGGVAGFGYGEGATNSLIGAGVGMTGGAAIGAGGQVAVNALAPYAARAGNTIANVFRGRQVPVDAAEVRQVTDAAERLGVRDTVRRYDVDPNMQGRRAQVQQNPDGRAAIGQAETDDLAALERAMIDRLGGNTARPSDAGGGIQSGVTAARDRLRNEAQVNYRAASAEAGNIQPTPQDSLQAIDQQIAELTANGARGNRSQIQYLKDLRADLADGLSIDGLRARRSSLRADLDNNNLYSTDFERRVGLVLDGVSTDIERALANNPNALARYQRADQLWRQQAEVGSEIGDALLGRNANSPLGPGQAADRVLLWARKDPRRLNRLMAEVDEPTRAEVRALVAGQLGRQANGNFSLATFLTNTGRGSGSKVSPASIRALFGDDGARAIEDLRVLAQARVDAQAATNRSNTGGLVEKARNSIRRLVLGGFGFSAADGTGMGAIVGGTAIAAGEFMERLGRERALRLLLNPDFSSWLRKLPSSNSPQAIDGAFGRLRRVAARTPGMSADVQAFERMLLGVANDNSSAVRSAVAEEEPQNDKN